MSDDPPDDTPSGPGAAGETRMLFRNTMAITPGHHKHCEVARFEVFGDPSAEVRAGFGRMSGMDTTIRPRLVGYLSTGV